MAPGAYKFLSDAGNLADRLGISVYLVGGGVRDILMHKHGQDVDLVVEGDGTLFSEKVAEVQNLLELLFVELYFSYSVMESHPLFTKNSKLPL